MTITTMNIQERRPKYERWLTLVASIHTIFKKIERNHRTDHIMIGWAFLATLSARNKGTLSLAQFMDGVVRLGYQVHRCYVLVCYPRLWIVQYFTQISCKSNVIMSMISSGVFGYVMCGISVTLLSPIFFFFVVVHMHAGIRLNILGRMHLHFCFQSAYKLANLFTILKLKQFASNWCEKINSNTVLLSDNVIDLKKFEVFFYLKKPRLFSDFRRWSQIFSMMM